MIPSFSSENSYSKIPKSYPWPSFETSSSQQQHQSSTSNQERDHLFKNRFRSSSSSFEYGNFTFHLYPDFTRAIAETIKYYKWPNIIFLYNTDTGK